MKEGKLGDWSAKYLQRAANNDSATLLLGAMEASHQVRVSKVDHAHVDKVKEAERRIGRGSRRRSVDLRERRLLRDGIGQVFNGGVGQFLDGRNVLLGPDGAAMCEGARTDDAVAGEGPLPHAAIEMKVNTSNFLYFFQ